MPGKIRIFTLIESAQPVGPAKSMIEIARAAAQPRPGLPSLEIMIGSYSRGTGHSSFIQAALDAGLTAFTIPERGRFDRSVMPQLRDLVDRIRPDILESQNVKSHLFVRLLKLYQRYPWVAWNHGYTATSALDRMYSEADRWSLPKAFRAVTVCGPFAERMRRRGAARGEIVVKHSFVKPFTAPPEEEIAAVRRKFGIGEEPVILAVGRLSGEKGHADLFHALAAVNRISGLPGFRAVIVGDGPERDGLAALASRLGIQDKVVMTGFQKDVRPFYGMATILALPSHSEGSPYVVLEAMAAGVPIAASRVGGVPEIIEDGTTGLLVPGRNPAAMAEAIRRLLTDSLLRDRLAQAGRLHANRHYSFEEYVEWLARFYQETLEKFKV